MRILTYCLLAFILVPRTPAVNETEFDEAFSNEHMKSLLNWAIENSDPDELHARAQAMADEDIMKHRARVEEMMDLMSHHVTDSDLMKESLDILKKASSSEPKLVYALHSLQVHVERIDNANDLKSMDGILAIVEQLKKSETIAAEAAIVLGVAAANNPTFQTHLLEAEPHIFTKLIKMLRSEDERLIGNSLYAIASLLRNQESVRTVFYANGGILALHQMLEKHQDSTRLKRKSLALLADLIQIGDLQIIDDALIQIIVKLLDTEDWDVVEKASHMISLLAQNPQSLANLKSLQIGSILAQKRLTAMRELEAKAGGNEYLQEIVNSLKKLSKLFESEPHVEL